MILPEDDAPRVEDGVEGIAGDDLEGEADEVGADDLGHPCAHQLGVDADARQNGGDVELDVVAEHLEFDQGLGPGLALADLDLVLDAVDRRHHAVVGEAHRLGEDVVEHALGVVGAGSRTGEGELELEGSVAERDGSGTIHDYLSPS